MDRLWWKKGRSNTEENADKVPSLSLKAPSLFARVLRRPLLAAGFLGLGCQTATQHSNAKANDEDRSADLAPWDVSVLLAPPATLDEWDALPRADEVGEKGILFPYEVMEKVAPDFSEGLPGELAYQALRLVAARLDPCPTRTTDCRPEVRIVFQPRGGTDAAIHAFYSIDTVALRELAYKLRKVRVELIGSAEPTTDWSVHPAAANSNTRLAFVATLKGALLGVAGASTLTRVAKFSFPGSFPDVAGFQSWTFAAFDLNDGMPSPAPLRPGSSLIAQLLDTNAFIEPATRQPRNVAITAACNVRYRITPVEQTSPSLDGQFLRGLACSTTADAAALQLDLALRILNPSHTKTSDIDCSSCHLAPQQARLMATKFNLPSAMHRELFGPNVAGITRAFGFHRLDDSNTVAVVSPRVRYETAVTLQQLAVP